MEIKKIVERCEKFELYEVRKMCEDYAEFVMYTKELSNWSVVFNEILGDPVSPAGFEPTDDDVLITKEYGGIFNEQTLYRKDVDNNTVIAMFWPWQDGNRVTVKVVILKKQ